MDTSMYETDDKTHRRKVIIVTTLIALVVLSIAAWAIVAISTSDQNLKGANTQIATDDGANTKDAVVVEETEKEAPTTEGVTTEVKVEAEEVKTEEGTKEEVKVEETKTEEDSTPSVIPVPAAPATENTDKEETNKEAEKPEDNSKNYFNRTTTAPEAVPETGPEELLPLALVAGLGAAFVASAKMAKRS